jgi:hypothetical protein
MISLDYMNVALLSVQHHIGRLLYRSDIKE